jgi:hypothetical protein
VDPPPYYSPPGFERFDVVHDFFNARGVSFGVAPPATFELVGRNATIQAKPLNWLIEPFDRIEVGWFDVV